MLVEVQRSGSPVVVDGVADEFVLQLAEDAEVKAREADRSKLRIATHWAERHLSTTCSRPRTGRDADPRDLCEAIGGEGTPLVHGAAVTPLAAALGVSARTAMQLMSDGLDLAPAAPDPRGGGGAAARALAGPADRAPDPPTEPRGGGVRRREARAGRRLRGAAGSSGWSTRRPHVRHRGAGRGRGRREGSLGHSPRRLPGPIWAGTSRLEIIGDTPTLTKLLRPGQPRPPTSSSTRNNRPRSNRRWSTARWRRSVTSPTARARPRRPSSTCT